MRGRSYDRQHHGRASLPDLLADLEHHRTRARLNHAELEVLITTRTEEVCGLAQSGQDDARKLRPLALEQRARLLLHSWCRPAVS